MAKITEKDRQIIALLGGVPVPDTDTDKVNSATREAPCRSIVERIAAANLAVSKEERWIAAHAALVAGKSSDEEYRRIRDQLFEEYYSKRRS